MSQETKKQKKGADGDVPLDFSFLQINEVKDIEAEEPRQSVGKKKHAKNDDGKYDCRCIKLNNNVMSELKGFSEFISNLLVCPNSLSWVDLSLNELTKIDPAFCDMPSLKILYLHGNSINDIKEIDKLAGLPNLTKLTLHGNPIDSVKNYRFYVVAKIPQLRSFDMSALTKADRATALTHSNCPTSKKKSKKDN